MNQDDLDQMSRSTSNCKRNRFVRFGVSTYSNNASLDILLTDNYINITNGMDYYSQSFSGGSTNIAAGIDAGQACFSTSPGARAYTSKVIVVRTDGIATAGSSPVQAATSAAAQFVHKQALDSAVRE